MRYYGSAPFRFNVTPWVKRLLVANFAVVLVLWLIGFASGPQAQRTVVDYVAFSPGTALFHPWTLVTYMFVHVGFWHIFFNMLMLFFFGPPLEEKWGSAEFLKYYIVAGIGGAMFGFIFAWDSSVIGASGAVFGIMLAFAMNWPNAPIYIWGIFPVKAKWLVAFLAGVAFLSTMGGTADGVAHFAHLGGLVFGFAYLKLGDAASIKVAGLKKKMETRRRLIVVSGDKPADSESRRTRRAEEERLLDAVDRVLDKISTSGIASLSAEERKLLDDVSRRYRQK